MPRNLTLVTLICPLLIWTKAWSQTPLIATNSCQTVLQTSSFGSSHYYQNSEYRIVAVKASAFHEGQVFSIELQPGVTTWGSNRNQFNENSPVGDLRRLFSIMPDSVATFLGFEAWDKFGQQSRTRIPDISRIQIPDMEALNAAFEVLDKKLRSRGQFGFPFRLSADAGITPPRDFLMMYSDLNQIPFSTHPQISYHDLNYHVFPFLLLDQELYRHSLLKTEIVLHYAKWLKEKNFPDIKPQDLERIYYARSHHLDLFANIRSFFMMRAFDEDQILRGSALAGIRNFVGLEGSAADYLLGITNALAESGNPRLQAHVRDFLKSVIKRESYFAVDEKLKKDFQQPHRLANRLTSRLDEIRKAVTF